MENENKELELSERQLTILDAIIRNYLATGEPVGSRTISKYTDLNLSSATIRNEMSDLEEMGYIVQPHTSAGRIPSDKGYRLYVDHLIETNDKKEKELSDMKDLVIENTEKMEQVLKQAAKVLANNTNYATLVSAPDVNHNKVKFIQLSQVDDQHLLAVIVMNNNMVRNKMLDLYEPLDNETILKLNILLNTSLNGLAMNEINLGNIASIKERAGIHSGIVSDVIDALAQTFAESEDLKIYTSGATNILKYPELSDSNNAATLLSAFEEKEELASLVTESLSDSEKKDNGTGIQVYIGNESPIQTMKDCSVVTATYDLGEGVKGTIGIVGPKRMDYEKVMDNLKTLKSQLDGIYKKSEDETQEGGQKIQEDIKKETIDNETAENKAEEIEIEGADEENTQAAEETKDTDVNEAKSEDDASADADEKKGLFKKKKKDKKDEQIEELNDRLKRQMAEFENFRKRSEKEKTQMFDMGAKTIVEKILPVIDNFERGLAAVPDDKKDDPFITGMDKVYKQMLTELDAAGVKPIECVGQEFDPDFHNAVMQVENDELESGTVAQELQKGYMYKDSVVRHSMVSVVQ